MDNSITQCEYVFTKTAKCQDCYRCLKACPVKAIKIKNGQAYIIEERCINCNICAQNCAQNAIFYKNDKEKFYELLKSKRKKVVSVAPSYASICTQWERTRFPSALRRLGFDVVYGTSMAAYIVAHRTMEIVNANPNKSYITSLCPTVINYIEKYCPDLIDNLIPLASPYLAHAKWLKEKFGDDVAVVHLDSCIPKKMEILRPEFAGLVDIVLSFAELKEVFLEQDIHLKTCEESEFEGLSVGDSRHYQLVGGLSTVAGVKRELLATEILSVSGSQDIKNSLDFVKTNRGILVEPLFCYKGCINGPGMHIKSNIFERRKEMIEYIKTRKSEPIENDLLKSIDITRTFSKENILNKHKFTIAQIRNVLAKTGNSDPEKRPNCFSCGYPTCSDKAIADLEDMAEIEMCIPYMRRFAESKAAKIIASSPYGIVTLNAKYEVTSMNQAFKKFFIATDSVIGKPISHIMDPEPFHKLNTEKLNILDCTVKHDKYDIVCHQVIYKLEDDNSYVGMFVNITKNIADKSHLDELRKRTLDQAQELLAQQINMATGISKILGENTAYSEALLDNLIKFTQSEQFQTNNISDNNFSTML
jgi:iron only hydrogenase large subunit-like protein